MKKLLSILLCIFVIFTITACSNENEDFDVVKFSSPVHKTDRIDILYNGNRVDLITGHTNIEKLISLLQIDNWKLKDLPKNCTKEFELILYSEKLDENKESTGEFTQMGEMTTYKDERFITLSLDKIQFHFKVPKDVIKYIQTFK